jgi:hypothetical protein
MKHKDTHVMAYRMKKEVWAKLTHMKAEGKIKSYQDVIDAALDMMIERLERRKTK